jgi:DNA mismatch repair protein MutL
VSRIRRLPDALVNKIAAGEVVERPASVVKELVENALDAGACRIAVDLGDAGRRLVRARDDGTGMTAEELTWALTRHATSKIATEVDLEAIETLGFRGEALPAICAVSRFTLTSCPVGAPEGARVRGEGGKVLEALQVAAPPGTTVEIEDLFFNTPARLKFLKSPRAELAQILRLLQQVALAHPEVHLEATHEGRSVLNAPRAATLRDRVGALYGFDLAGRLLPVERRERDMAVSGLVSPPDAARGSRDEITIIVNGRPVRDQLLTQTLLEAYRPLLPRDQFPVAVLALTLPAREVDVNVHPAKAWVRFRAPRLVQEALFLAVQEALRSAAAAQRGLQPAGLPGATAPAPARAQTGPDPGAEGGVGLATSPAGAAVAAAPPADQGLLFREAVRPFGEDRFGTVVGQLHDTFIVAADAQEVFFVDQHVAHERVLFERLLGEARQGPLPAQALLFSQPLPLSPGQAALLEEWAPVLARLGFDLEGFGAGTVLLRAVPVLLREREPRRLLERLLDEVGAPADPGQAPLERALAFVACRAAVKAGAPLEREEMQRLLADLGATATPYFCPHGRPVVSRLPLAEIRRELRRTW